MTQRKTRTSAPRHTHSQWPAIAGVAAAALLASAVAVKRRTNAAEAQHPPIGDFIRVDGVDLHYIDSGGKKPAIVLLHGNGAMIQDFEISGLIDALAPHHRVIAFDRPGYGWSTRPRHVAWTPEAQAKLFYKAIRELGLEKPVILGHSWGAMAAVAMGLQYHLHISGLVLASGYYFPTARADVALLSPPAIPLLGGVLRHTVAPFLGYMIAPAAIAKMFAPQPVSEKFHEAFPLGLALRPVQIRASSEEAAMMVPAAARLQDHYGRLAIPVSIIAGAADHIVDPQRQSAALHHAIPHSRLTLIQDAGHMVHYTSTAAVAKAADELFKPRAAPAARRSSSKNVDPAQPTNGSQQSGTAVTH